MSLLSSITSAVSSIGKTVLRTPLVSAVAKFIPGLGTAATVVGAYQTIKGIAAGVGEQIISHPAATGAVLGGAAGAIVGRETAPPAGVGGGLLTPLGGGGMARGMAPRGARGLIRSANSYARRYPQWAMSVGGTQGIAQMIANGQLPMVKRSRGRGISSRDLRSFKRVARLINHFSRPVHHMRGYGRGKHARVQ